jgi:hypothetical protein
MSIEARPFRTLCPTCRQERMNGDWNLSSIFADAASIVSPQAGDKGLQERRLEDALVGALAATSPASEISARRALPGFSIPDWDPQPGAVDIAVVHDGVPRMVLEVKLDDVQHSILDILKMASASTAPEVELACVAVAARTTTWHGRREGVALFEPPKDDWPSAPTWSTEFILTEYSRRWQKMMAETRGRPRRLPATLELGWIGAFDVPAFLGYELRALTVRAAFDDSIELDENGHGISTGLGSSGMHPEGTTRP